MAANRSTHALTKGKGVVFNRRGKETNARLDDSIFSSLFFFLSDAQANLFSKFCLYSLVPLFFSFIMKKQILLGSWKQLREILDISLGHCRFTFVGTDYTERIFFTDFIQVLLNFFLEIWDISTIKCTIVYSGVILYSTRRIEYQRKYEDVLCSVYMKI